MSCLTKISTYGCDRCGSLVRRSYACIRDSVIVGGTNQAVTENVGVVGITKRDGNCRRAINRMMRMSGVGKFWKLVIQNAEKEWCRCHIVYPRYTSQECRYTDKKNRPGQDTFCSIYWGEELHANVNTAGVILKWRVSPDGHYAGGQTEVQATLMCCAGRATKQRLDGQVCARTMSFVVAVGVPESNTHRDLCFIVHAPHNTMLKQRHQS